MNHQISIIKSVTKGNADRQLQTMTTIIVSFTAKRFGVKEGITNRPRYTMNQRSDKIHQLQQEIWTLARRFKVATGEEKSPLADLCNIIRKKLMTLCRTE